MTELYCQKAMFLA